MKVLFVILDTLRPDYLEPYGSTWVKTPNIARLAEQSVVCDNHWVGSLPCMPARREFMTGRHNFLERGWGPVEPFDDVLPNLLRQTQPKGVFSHLITDHYHYFYLGGEGHNNSFSTWQFERGQESDFWVSRVDAPALPENMGRLKDRPQNALNRLAQREEHEFSGPRCVQHAMRWLDENQGSDDWFVQLELFDPHEPFYVVQEYLDMYEDKWDGPIYDWPDYGVATDSPEAIEHIRKCYAALVTMTDHWLGKLWDKLDRLDLWKDTMVVLTTDHGTMLGEHQYWMKNMMPVYNEIARIPLIVHLPGSQRAGSRVSALTQTTDVMPTFLDYFSAPVPPHLHGTSLRPSIEANQSVHDSIIYGYFGMALNATDGRHTYFRNPVKEEAIVHAYTSMPTQFHGFMPREELADAEMGRFLGHTYNIPVYKIPTKGRPPHRHEHGPNGEYVAVHELYDVAADPNQERPLNDSALETHFQDLMRTHLERVKAPEGHLERLGL
ncbi:MAG TPA: sulfatase-like hydrolase/transferase [Chloroflexota bacterium]|nr:sulfatase-like hydrolase/transferase [Chloroflexota bacterium]